MRFNLIDQVVEKSAERIVAVKNVSRAEEYLDDHFPSFPVLPGVMMLETLVQAGRHLLVDIAGKGAPLVVTDVRNVKYGNMVRPGQSLTVEVTLRGAAKDGVGWDLQGVGKVDDNVAVQGRFRLEPLVIEQ